MMCCHHLDRSGRLEARAERLVRMEVPARANGSGRMEKLARMERLERAEGPGWAKVPGRAKRPGRPRGSPLQYTRPAHHLWNIVGVYARPWLLACRQRSCLAGTPALVGGVST